MIIGDHRAKPPLQIGRKRLQIEHRLVGERLLHQRQRGAGGAAQQAECGFGFHRDLKIAKPQCLLFGVEQRLAPDEHGGIAAEAKPTGLFASLDLQRDQ